jgi:SPP1 family predicted phage head-tail adaptor
LGQLCERLTIQQPTYAASTQSGQGVASWSTLAEVWGAVRALSAGESMQAQSISASQTYEIEIRHRADVTPAMRVQWAPYGGTARTFEIHGLSFGARRADRLILRCGELA